MSKKIPKSVIFVKKAKLTPNFPSNTREIQSEFSFFDENYTFLDFLIDLLFALNELNLFLMCEYWICAANSTGFLVLHEFSQTNIFGAGIRVGVNPFFLLTTPILCQGRPRGDSTVV